VTPKDQDHCIIRLGHPRGYQFHFPGAVSAETVVERSAIDQLLELLKTIHVPVFPGEDQSMFILDGATHGFEAQLGSTRFSYECELTDEHLSIKERDRLAACEEIITCGLVIKLSPHGWVPVQSSYHPYLSFCCTHFVAHKTKANLAKIWLVPRPHPR
jgi:hypothetical protein